MRARIVRRGIDVGTSAGKNNPARYEAGLVRDVPLSSITVRAEIWSIRLFSPRSGKPTAKRGEAALPFLSLSSSPSPYLLSLSTFSLSIIPRCILYRLFRFSFRFLVLLRDCDREHPKPPRWEDFCEADALSLSLSLTAPLITACPIILRYDESEAPPISAADPVLYRVASGALIRAAIHIVQRGSNLSVITII